MKPPCMFAHSVIRGASARGGAAFRSRASRRAALHAAASGSASTCGRARRFGSQRATPSATVTPSAAPERSRATRTPMISAAPDAATAVSRVTALKPPARKAKARRSSENHSCAVHGAPGIEWLNGSAWGAAAMGEDPLARRQMRPGVSVAQHRGGESRDREQGDGDQREDEARGARFCALSRGGAGSGGKRERHGRKACLRRDKARLTLAPPDARPNVAGYGSAQNFSKLNPSVSKQNQEKRAWISLDFLGFLSLSNSRVFNGLQAAGAKKIPRRRICLSLCNAGVSTRPFGRPSDLNLPCGAASPKQLSIPTSLHG